MTRICFYISCFFFVFLWACRQPRVPGIVMPVDHMPVIFPDYTGVTVPYNIAPLNFRLDEPCSNIAVTVSGRQDTLECAAKGNKISFNLSGWHKLLEQHRGEELQVKVFARDSAGWKKYLPFKIIVAPDPIDDYLVYRLILPGFQNWNEMGIYQRSLSSFQQEPVLNSKLMPGTCMNCHSFARNDPENMILHLRENNSGTFMVRDGQVERLQTKTPEMFAAAAFPYWHPSRKYIAFSVDQVRQIFHATGPNRAHALDMNSDMVVYDIEKNEMITSPLLFSKEVFETFPCFHPDGEKLFFCSSPARNLPDDYDKMKYSLCVVSFDPRTGSFGSRVDTLISAFKTGKSISMPRVSPDGRFIMFNLSDYGNFPAYNPESDLYLYDLQNDTREPLTALNSEHAESYHGWSSNGRWVVFSSRRVDGLFAAPFLAYMDQEGNPGKPFLLPQQNAGFYQNFLYSFNIPELVKHKINIPACRLEAVAKKAVPKQVKSGGFR